MLFASIAFATVSLRNITTELSFLFSSERVLFYFIRELYKEREKGQCAYTRSAFVYGVYAQMNALKRRE